MRYLLEWRTLGVMSSAAIAAIIGIAFAQSSLLTHIFFRILYFGEILFHELGHTLFFWLFGSFAIPSIMTAIGADKAGGVSLVLFHHIGIQLLALGALAYGCYYLWREERPFLFYPAMIVTLLIVVLSFTPVREWLPIYMGQGGSILVCGILLYRAWLDVGIFHGAERWLNALYGFFILFHNLWFCHQLMSDTPERARYVNQELTNDFVVLASSVPGWTLAGIAQVTFWLCIAVLILSTAFAAYFAESEQHDVGF